MTEPSKTAIHLIRSLLSYCGIDAGNDLEDESKVLLSIDDRTALLVVVENHLIHFIACLGPSAVNQSFYRLLLEENFKTCARAGYRYSVAPGNGELLMTLTLCAEGMQVNELVNRFEAFLRFSEKWIKSLAAGIEIIPDEAEDAGKSIGAQVTSAGPHTKDPVIPLIRV